MDALFYNLITALIVALILLGLYSWVTVVRQSFKGGPLLGVTVALLPPVTLWYMFARFEHDLKLLVVGSAMLGLWVAASVAFLPRLLA